MNVAVEKMPAYITRISGDRWSVIAGRTNVSVKTKKDADALAALLRASGPWPEETFDVWPSERKDAFRSALDVADVGPARVIVCEDGRVEVRGNRNGLFAMMAEGNCLYANVLSAIEVCMVFACVERCPFPLGTELKVMDTIKASEEELTHRFANVLKHPVGKLRKMLVDECGSGCNAPNDSYLRWWVQRFHPDEYAAIDRA